MNKSLPKDHITTIFNDPERVRAAMQKGIDAALLKHKKLGYPICVWREGKVVWIPAKDIQVKRS